MLRQYRLKDYNFRLIIWVIALSVVGILVIGSAKESVQTKQIAGLILGLVVMVITSLIDYSWVLGFYWLSYFVGIGLLAAVLLAGENVGGATRWIRVGGVLQFQPSDVVKILMIAFFAKFFSKHEEDISRFKTILIALLLVAAPTALLLKEPDLSTTIVFVLLFCAMFFVSGLSYKIVGGIIVACVPLAVLLMSLILSPDQQVLQGYQANRILAWLKPEEYPDIARQQVNSIIAIGSGQLYGKGLDNNVVSSVKNGNFISESQTDFIFAVAGEELGFLGCCIIIILELLIALECINIGRHARDPSRHPCRVRNGSFDLFSELYQHLCYDWPDAKHRPYTSLCKLRADISCQLLYRNRSGSECRASGTKILTGGSKS